MTGRNLKGRSLQPTLLPRGASPGLLRAKVTQKGDPTIRLIPAVLNARDTQNRPMALKSARCGLMVQVYDRALTPLLGSRSWGPSDEYLSLRDQG